MSPNISTIKNRQLEDNDYVVFNSTADEFFNLLIPLVQGLVPDTMTLLKNRFPHEIAALSQGLLSQQSELSKGNSTS